MNRRFGAQDSELRVSGQDFKVYGARDLVLQTLAMVWVNSSAECLTYQLLRKTAAGDQACADASASILAQPTCRKRTLNESVGRSHKTQAGLR